MGGVGGWVHGRFFWITAACRLPCLPVRLGSAVSVLAALAPAHPALAASVLLALWLSGWPTTLNNKNKYCMHRNNTKPSTERARMHTKATTLSLRLRATLCCLAGVCASSCEALLTRRHLLWAEMTHKLATRLSFLPLLLAEVYNQNLKVDKTNEDDKG